jgi:hypothetical protein
MIALKCLKMARTAETCSEITIIIIGVEGTSHNYIVTQNAAPLQHLTDNTDCLREARCKS